MNIHVTIDRLILEGLTVPHGERQALQEVVAAELGRLLGEQGLAADWLAGGAVARLRGGNVEWSAGVGAVPLGQQIAQAVVPSLGTGEGPGGGASPGRSQ